MNLMKTISVASLSVASLSVYAAAGGNYTLRVMPALWSATTDGTIDYDSSTSTASDASKAGLENGEYSFSVQAGARLPLLFDVHGGFFKYSTTGTLDSAMDFADIPFAVNDKSSYDLTDMYLEVAYSIGIDTAGMGVGIAGHYLTTEITFEGAATETFEESIIVPALAARIYVLPVEYLSIDGRAHWLEMDFNGTEVSFLDVEAMITYYPTSVAGVSLGYRTYSLDATYSDFSDASINFGMGGPFLAATLQW